MTTHVLQAALIKPEPLPSASWDSIMDAFSRLQRACAGNDRPLIVGSAKDLVEAVARVTLDMRGQPAGSGDAYDTVLSKAHEALQYQPGDGIAADAAVRQAANSAKKMAALLRELRNSYDTGHGRAAVPQIEDEVVETCVDAALLWTRWALRRLNALVLGRLGPLIDDLRGGIFTAGTLAMRLSAADLANLGEGDQRRLGVAVGQRASRDTFNVRIEGVRACANNPDDATWPPQYRAGVVIGMFIDEDGNVSIDTSQLAPVLAAQIIAAHPDAPTLAGELADTVAAARWSPSFQKGWRSTVAALDAEARVVPDGPRGAWLRMARSVEAAGEAYEKAYGH